jgi:hypothetical protein
VNILFYICTEEIVMYLKQIRFSKEQFTSMSHFEQIIEWKFVYIEQT